MPVSYPKAATVDEYIAAFPVPVQKKLLQIRSAIREAAPEAEEVISYAIPAYRQNGMLVYFSAYTHHVSLASPPLSLFEVFKEELAPYKTSKSTVQFPLDTELPLELIKKMTRYRVEENQRLASQKKKK